MGLVVGGEVLVWKQQWRTGRAPWAMRDMDADTHLWKGTQHPCSQRRATVSVEGGSEQSPLGRDQGCMLVGHGARSPESTEGMAGREGGKGKPE